MQLNPIALVGRIGLILCCCHPGLAAEQGDMSAAIDRGLKWVMAHPASDEDGGFVDMVDEGLFYSMIERLSSEKRLACMKSPL